MLIEYQNVQHVLLCGIRSDKCPSLFVLAIIVFRLNFLVNKNFLKVDNKNIRKRCKICSKLAIKTLVPRNVRASFIFVVNFEDISTLFLVFLF